MIRPVFLVTAFSLLAGCGSCGNEVTVPCANDLDCAAPLKCINGGCREPGPAGGGSGGSGGNAGGTGGTAGGMVNPEDGGRFDCITAPLTCASQGFNCGPAGNGCGIQLDCGDCTMPETCGGGGTPGVCGRPITCVPKTCADLDAGCGQQSNGCGGLTPNCGTCTMPEICGGAGIPSRCGAILPDAGTDAGRPCVNLCQQQMACTGMPKTTITGTVLAPTPPAFGNPDPLPGAFVYVPNGTVTPFTPGVQCEKCSASVSGDPLVSATSAVNGTFTLENAPCGQNIPLVIQLGRWRRQITIPNVACCANTALTADQSRLPRRQAEGSPNDNIPLFAVTTGSADNLECILPKIGIDSSEFTTPAGTGRVRLYRDNGVNPLGGLPAATTLYNDPTELAKYDVVVIDCVGGESNKSAAQRGNLESYANNGGRVFTSHYGYVWLYNDPNTISFTGTATWQPEQPSPSNQDAYIDVTSMAGQRFGQWVYAVGAQAATSTMAIPKIRVNTVRRDFNSVIAPAERWVWGTPTGTGNAPEVPLQYAFNTPLAAAPADKCGRVLFSDFHVSSGGSFPSCATSGGALTPQEKVFEYLIFDLTSCVTPYTQVCTPISCSQQGLRCGPASDGCGNVIQCGNCPSPQTCGGGGVPGQCGGGCIPRTCQSLGYNCGPAGDGCGALLDCGNCPQGMRCGVITAGVCGPEIG
ncbi:MAG: hypothetical protein JNK82_42235 [Myxococcaceae bacterium]|nr:hypothetical protein [Myxococcaceae bacterium]